jgi:hypothetical protein
LYQPLDLIILEKAVKEDLKFGQLLEKTKDFELFGDLNPGTVRMRTENSKDEVILGR